MTLYVKKLHPQAVIPTRATAQSAGYDLSACLTEPLEIPPGETRMVPTGLAIQLPEGTAGMVYPRSGLASKFSITLINAVGVIDSDYRGELKVPLHNHGNAPFLLHNGDRMAQLVVTPVLFPEVEEVSALTETNRGTGGFGSTGISGKQEE